MAVKNLGHLAFSAVNAGYKDSDSSQNYDFIELTSSASEFPLALVSYKIIYYNSSGNIGGEFGFGQYDYLTTSRLALFFKDSPQAKDLSSKYLYNFGSAGLASTAGKLELYYQDKLIDELCWGKLTCQQSFPKFSTSANENRSIYVCDTDCPVESYLPETTPSAIIEQPPVLPDLESCAGIEFSEIFSYYTEDSSEQFIELYNPNSHQILLDNCQLNYKKSHFALAGYVLPGQYYIFKDNDLSLTKNPVKPIELTITDSAGRPIATASQVSGQKRGASLAKINQEWKISYAPTPGALNQYQQFQTCESGKIINPKTGNCINDSSSSESKLTPCKIGYYRNPLTGRCRKNPTPKKTTTCKTGYVLNPDTNRCRKAITQTGQDYAPTPVSQGEHSSSQNFVALWAVIVAIALLVLYVAFQFRHEISSFIKRIILRIRHFFYR